MGWVRILLYLISFFLLIRIKPWLPLPRGSRWWEEEKAWELVVLVAGAAGFKMLLRPGPIAAWAGEEAGG